MIIQVLRSELLKDLDGPRVVGIFEVDAPPRIYDTVRVKNDTFTVTGVTWVLDAERDNCCVIFVTAKEAT